MDRKEHDVDPALLASLLIRGLPTNPLPPPAPEEDDPAVPHAPVRTPNLTNDEFKLAVKNALRYFPAEYHAELATEFARELKKYGHIYMRRFRPTEYPMKAYPIHYYPAKTKQAAAIMLMIMNNLDPAVAQFPHELITYGGNGSVFQNWAQYHLVMKYLSEMTEEQTLVIYSGHPLGLFPSHRDAPRVVITNGMVVPNYSSKADYERYYAMGVSMYGQMTAGSYCYIGPQGIVHGTTITLLNAGRKYLGLTDDLRGKIFVSSGLGGMSGAQAKAAVICGGIGVIAEVNEAALVKRLRQGWVVERIDDLERLIERLRELRRAPLPSPGTPGLSIGYHGNVVTLWERLAKELENTGERLVDLGSDQTSLHNPFGGGYYPVQLSFDEANRMIRDDPVKFRELVQESLRRQVVAINTLSARGMRFWDYGNSFLLEAGRAGADIFSHSHSYTTEQLSQRTFRYPSYVQDIMGDIFSLGFGPFRWVCTSGDPSDLRTTDRLAAAAIDELGRAAAARDPTADPAGPRVAAQYRDNGVWISRAEEHRLVVGSQARILYTDAPGRLRLARMFNAAVADGTVRGPIVLSRDHHDVSGTDSPYRETSNITDGSKFCADMAVQNFVGDGFRGATWIALHNGGGTGWGEAVNGGFGLVLDGSPEAERRAENMLFWDVMNGIARRAWAGNENAELTMARALKETVGLKVTMPVHAKEEVIEKACAHI